MDRQDHAVLPALSSPNLAQAQLSSPRPWILRWDREGLALALFYLKCAAEPLCPKALRKQTALHLKSMVTSHQSRKWPLHLPGSSVLNTQDPRNTQSRHLSTLVPTAGLECFSIYIVFSRNQGREVVAFFDSSTQRQRQMYLCVFEVSLVYIASCRAARNTERH